MKKGVKKAGKETSKKAVVTVEGLIEQGNNAVAKYQPDLAVKFFERARDMSPYDTDIMDALADVHLQLGDQEEALELLLASTSLAPETNPFKWLYLAQLQIGSDAVESYMRAVSLLDMLIESGAENTDPQMLKSQIAKAHCSIGELYLTDLCYDDDAEAKCEEAINKAIAADQNSLDGQQALASLRISQCRTAEAAVIIEGVFHRVKAIRDKISARTVIEEMSGVEEPEECKDAPEFEFCIVTAKYLIECAAVKPQLAEHAMVLITDLLHDDDENVEIWYMMGVASLSCTPPDTDSARYHLEAAKDMMDKLLEDLEEEEFPYAEHYDLVKEHLRILDTQEGREHTGNGEAQNGKAKGVSKKKGVEVSDSMVDDEEWSDCDEDEEGEEEEGKGASMSVDEAS